MLVLSIISGILQMTITLRGVGSGPMATNVVRGHKAYIWCAIAKMVILVFLTPVSDYIAMSWIAVSGQR